MEADQEDNKPCKFVLDCGSKQFELEEEFANISGLAQFSKQSWGFSENGMCKISINQDIADVKTIAEIVQWVKDHNYNPPSILQICSDKLDENLKQNSVNIKFLKQFHYQKDKKEIKKYFEASKYLQIENLTKLMLVPLAQELYFGKTEQDFLKMQEKFKIKNDFTMEQEQKQVQEHQWIQRY